MRQEHSSWIVMMIKVLFLCVCVFRVIEEEARQKACCLYTRRRDFFLLMSRKRTRGNAFAPFVFASYFIFSQLRRMGKKGKIKREMDVNFFYFFFFVEKKKQNNNALSSHCWRLNYTLRKLQSLKCLAWVTRQPSKPQTALRHFGLLRKASRRWRRKRKKMQRL